MDTVGGAKKQRHYIARSQMEPRRDGTTLTHAISVTGQVPPLRGRIRGGGSPRADALGFPLAPLRGSTPITSGLGLTLTTLACTS